jgi:AraC-like DNA-binding protein
MARFPELNFKSIERSWASQFLKVNIGSYCNFSKLTTNSKHYHKQGYEICYVISGNGIYYHGNETYHLQTGDIFLSQPNVIHEITSHETRDLLIIFFVFYPRSIGEPNENIFESQVIHRFLKNHKIHIPNQRHVPNYLELINHHDHNSFNNEVRILNTLSLLAIDLLSTFSEHSITEQQEVNRMNNSLRIALNYISRNISKPISVPEIAKEAHCSERHLRRLFQDHFQHSIIDEVHNQKCLHASKLLLMNYPVSKVAEEVGIHNHSQFSKLFKSILNTTPKQYQKANLVRVESNNAYPST